MGQKKVKSQRRAKKAYAAQDKSPLQPKRDFDILSKRVGHVTHSSSLSKAPPPVDYTYVPKDLDRQVLLAIEAAAVLLPDAASSDQDSPSSSSPPADEPPTDQSASRSEDSPPELTRAQLERFYELHHACCSAKHDNCARHPDCLAGLGDRNTGVWESGLRKMIDGSGQEALRSGRPHIGLRNLGATCYLNSLFQCLYMEEAFRRGVYAWKPEASHESLAACEELQLIFARLQLNEADYVDTQRLLAILEIPAKIQQDVTEFYMMFMSFLEKRFKTSSKPAVAELIPKLYGGRVVHSVKCLNCQTTTERSEEFREISLRIQGNKTLEDSLREYLHPEALNGANRYRCENCDALQDALKWPEFRELPDSLNFTLRRFDYHAARNGDFVLQKIKDKFQFPLVLDLTKILSDDNLQRVHATPSFVVDADDAAPSPGVLPASSTSMSSSLSSSPAVEATAVNSTSSSSSDAATVQAATQIASSSVSSAPSSAAPTLASTVSSSSSASSSSSSLPTTSADSSGSTTTSTPDLVYELKAVIVHIGESATSGHYYALIKDARTKNWWKFDDRSVKPIAVGDIGDAVVKPAPAPNNNRGGRRKRYEVLPPAPAPVERVPDGYISSSTAYMLFYTKASRPLGPLPEPDAELRRGVESANQRMFEHLTANNELRALIKSQMDEHRALYQEFLNRAPVGPKDDFPYHFIATSWLRRWAEGYYSVPAMQQLHKLADNNADDDDDDNGTAVADSNAFELLSDAPPVVAKQDSDVAALTSASMYEATPIDNSELVCVHGKVDPLQTSKMKRIHSGFWQVLVERFGGGPALSSEDMCAACCRTIERQTRAQQTYEQHKTRILNTLSRTRNEVGFWVSHDWIETWKAVSVPTSGAPSPDMTEGIVCPHGSLLPNFARARLVPQSVYRILFAYFPRGDEFPESSSRPCTLCGEEAAVAAAERSARVRSRSDERQSCIELYRRCATYWQLPVACYTYAVLPLAWVQEWVLYVDNADVLEPPPPIPLRGLQCEEHGGFVYSVDDREGRDHWIAAELRVFETLVQRYGLDGNPLRAQVSRSGAMTTDPPTCSECAAQRRQMRAREDLTYRDGDVWISKHAQSEHWPKCSSNETLARLLDGNQRRSPASDRIKLLVNSYDSVHTLKLRVFERCGVPVYRQQIWCQQGNVCLPPYDKSDAQILDKPEADASLLAELLQRRLRVAERLAATLPASPEHSPDQCKFGESVRDAVDKAGAFAALLSGRLEQATCDGDELAALAAAAREHIDKLTYDPDELTLAYWRIRRGATLRLSQLSEAMALAAGQSAAKSSSSSSSTTTTVAFHNTKLAGDTTPVRAN